MANLDCQLHYIWNQLRDLPLLASVRTFQEEWVGAGREEPLAEWTSSSNADPSIEGSKEKAMQCFSLVRCLCSCRCGCQPWLTSEPSLSSSANWNEDQLLSGIPHAFSSTEAPCLWTDQLLVLDSQALLRAAQPS